jgi:predicted CoA-binding protein
MYRLDSLRRLLEESSDPENPRAELIGKLFETMRRIAVIGLSRDPLKAARRVPSYLSAQGYEVVGVNPLAQRLLGRPAHPTLEDVEGELDMVVIFRPSEQAGRFVTDTTGRSERPAIWLQEGIRSDAQATVAREAGFLVVQDLCIYKVHRALFT